jgi:AcrR family transcriptional regulator
VGKEQLTTTLVAARAGVSVGTLYQYFPNKSALLQAVLKHHLTAVSDAIETACHELKGQSLQQMATGLITVFLQAKLKDVKTSVALYAVSSDVDGQRIAQQVGNRSNKAIVGMLTTASEPLTTDPKLVASMLQGAMFGVSRRMLESGAPAAQVDTMRRELIFFASAYLSACSLRPSVRHADTFYQSRKTASCPPKVAVTSNARGLPASTKNAYTFALGEMRLGHETRRQNRCLYVHRLCMADL